MYLLFLIAGYIFLRDKDELYHWGISLFSPLIYSLFHSPLIVFINKDEGFSGVLAAVFSSGLIISGYGYLYVIAMHLTCKVLKEAGFLRSEEPEI